MHFIHISPEDLRKHPWIGVAIGIIGMVLFSFVTYVAARDYMNFSKQKSPEIIDVENVAPDYLITRKWVTLTNFTLDCETVEQTRRTDPLEKLIVGQVYDTYIIITNSSGRQLIVAIFHVDVSCQNFQNQPLTGILTTTQDYSYGVAFFNTKLSRTTSVHLILRVNEGLGQSTIILIMGIVLDIVFFLSFVLKYSRLWLEKWESKFE
jgi:hypothetical protein